MEGGTLLPGTYLPRDTGQVNDGLRINSRTRPRVPRGLQTLIVYHKQSSNPTLSMVPGPHGLSRVPIDIQSLEGLRSYDRAAENVK